MSITFSGGGKSLNVASGGAETVFRMVNVRPAPYGSMDPRDVLVKMSLLRVREHVKKGNDNHGIEINADGIRPVTRVIDSGINEERIVRYVHALVEIAQAALEKEERVTWG